MNTKILMLALANVGMVTLTSCDEYEKRRNQHLMQQADAANAARMHDDSLANVRRIADARDQVKVEAARAKSAQKIAEAEEERRERRAGNHEADSLLEAHIDDVMAVAVRIDSTRKATSGTQFEVYDVVLAKFAKESVKYTRKHPKERLNIQRFDATDVNGDGVFEDDKKDAYVIAELELTVETLHGQSKPLNASRHTYYQHPRQQ